MGMETILYAERMDRDTWRTDKSYDGLSVDDAKAKLQRLGYEPYGGRKDNEFRYWKPYMHNKPQVRLFVHTIQ